VFVRLEEDAHKVANRKETCHMENPLTDLGPPPGERDLDVSRVNQLGSLERVDEVLEVENVTPVSP